MSDLDRFIPGTVPFKLLELVVLFLFMSTFIHTVEERTKLTSQFLNLKQIGH